MEVIFAVVVHVGRLEGFCVLRLPDRGLLLMCPVFPKCGFSSRVLHFQCLLRSMCRVMSGLC